VSNKPRVAFFDFACCEGCQLTVLSIGEPLIEVLKHVDIVTWREAMSEKSDEFDIAFIEGSITRDSDVPRLKRIREKARLVVALGSCAALGGHHVSDNRFETSELLEMAYGSKAEQ
jgi:coenzyme F420-reducing hydrogenase gamma subunit